MPDSSSTRGGPIGDPPCIHCGNAIEGEKCAECGLNAATSRRAQSQIGRARRDAFKNAFSLAVIPLLMVFILSSGIPDSVLYAGPRAIDSSYDGWLRFVSLFAVLGAAAQCVMLPAYLLLTTPERSPWVKGHESASREFVRYAAILQTLAIAASITTPGALRVLIPPRLQVPVPDITPVSWGRLFDCGLGYIALIAQAAIALAIARMMIRIAQRQNTPALQKAASATTVATVILFLSTFIGITPTTVVWLIPVVQMGFLWRYTRIPVTRVA